MQPWLLVPATRFLFDFMSLSSTGFIFGCSDLIELLTSTSFILVTLAVEMWATPWMVEDSRNSFRTSISGKAERELWPKLNWPLCQRVRRALTHPVLVILLIRSRSVLSCPPPIFRVCWKPRSFSILLLTRLHWSSRSRSTLTRLGLIIDIGICRRKASHTLFKVHSVAEKTIAFSEITPIPMPGLWSFQNTGTHPTPNSGLFFNPPL